GCDGPAEAEGITDREHPVTDSGLAVGQLREREVRSTLDLDQGDVGTRIGADYLGAEGLAVIGGHFDLVGTINHVVVGDGIAVGRNKEAGALTGYHATSTARGTPQAGRQAILSAEATEEALHR